MFSYELVGLLLIFVVGLLLTLIPVASQFPRRVGKILFLGLVFRLIGALARYAVLYGYYDGGDAGRYYRIGLKYARMAWQFDFSFFEPVYWELSRFWGTQFVMFVSGFTLSLIGPTKLGQFLLFSFTAFIALLLFSKAFQRNYPFANLPNYMLWVLLWPSLWFWPSSTGKDALMLFSTSLVVYGYAGRTNQISWVPTVLGLLLASLIRPHVAGVMGVSIALAHWLTPARTSSIVTHVTQGIGIMIIMLFVLSKSFSSLGLEDIDIEEIRNYVDRVSVQSSQGGSAIDSAGFGLTSIPFAIINILFRPFPWEAGNILSAAASAEMILFWTMIILRRKRILEVFKEWRSIRLTRLAVPMTILYIVMLGVAVGNLGIIARQRIHVIPLLLIWLEALPLSAAYRAPSLEPRPLSRIPVPQIAGDVVSKPL